MKIYRNFKDAFDIIADSSPSQRNWPTSQDALSLRLLVSFKKKEPEVCTLLTKIYEVVDN